MKKYPVVIFDVDGVLVNSLTPHLKICEDKNREYNLDLTIPNPAEFKDMVRKGTPVSPMNLFFEAVGFKSPYMEQAVEFYNQSFMHDYHPGMFDNVPQLLAMLSKEDVVIGIITSNVRNNIEDALEPVMKYFNADLIFSKDDPNFQSKRKALQLVADKLNIDTKNILYVGDQQADFESARNAGADFLGVTYGWGISDDKNKFPVVDDVLDIVSHVIGDFDARKSITDRNGQRGDKRAVTSEGENPEVCGTAGGAKKQRATRHEHRIIGPTPRTRRA